MLIHVDVLREAEGIQAQRRCFLEIWIGSVDCDIAAVSENGSVFALGRFNNEEFPALCAELMQELVDGVALAGTG